MLSAFPSLLSYALFVPLAFRALVGLIFVIFGYRNITENHKGKAAVLESFKLKPGGFWLWLIAVIEIAGGLLLIAGLYTQIAALVFSILLVITLAGKRQKPEVTALSQDTLLLLLLINASLLFLGAGFYAFDLPL